MFAQLAMERPHILLLDEPTNHLDMASIDALARAIKEYEGGVVIVSHDFRKLPSPRPMVVRAQQSLTPRARAHRSHLAGRRGVVGGQGPQDQESDQGGHHDRRLQEPPCEEQYVSDPLFVTSCRRAVLTKVLGYAALEKAKLFSKTTGKTKT